VVAGGLPPCEEGKLGQTRGAAALEFVRRNAFDAPTAAFDAPTAAFDAAFSSSD
jgi:hypothetical protein